MISYRGYCIDAVVAGAAWWSLVENPKGESCPIATSSATRREALMAASLHVNTLIASTPKLWS
jgi:hypothetical protein